MQLNTVGLSRAQGIASARKINQLSWSRQNNEQESDRTSENKPFLVQLHCLPCQNIEVEASGINVKLPGEGVLQEKFDSGPPWVKLAVLDVWTWGPSPQSGTQVWKPGYGLFQLLFQYLSGYTAMVRIHACVKRCNTNSQQLTSHQFQLQTQSQTNRTDFKTTGRHVLSTDQDFIVLAQFWNANVKSNENLWWFTVQSATSLTLPKPLTVVPDLFKTLSFFLRSEIWRVRKYPTISTSVCNRGNRFPKSPMTKEKTDSRKLALALTVAGWWKMCTCLFWLEATFIKLSCCKHITFFQCGHDAIFSVRDVNSTRTRRNRDANSKLVSWVSYVFLAPVSISVNAQSRNYWENEKSERKRNPPQVFLVRFFKWTPVANSMNKSTSQMYRMKHG